MEVNKDEAERCVELAKQYIQSKNKEKATKFLQKAERLFPTQTAKDLLVQVRLMPNTMESEPLRRRKPKVVETEEVVIEYTEEQKEAVLRIKKCKDYYEILNVKKDATDSEIKKAYKKLALQLHPDKNKYTGSAEAFKAIGNAVAILTDVEERKRYDLYGPEEERRTRPSRGPTYTRGFESEATAEELFNMFFGNGFGTGNVFVRRNGRTFRQNVQSENENHRENQQGKAAFFQLLPILLAIVLSMFSHLFISDPYYVLQASSKYPISRQTQHLGVPYFVKENFYNDYQGSLKRLEESIEEDFITNLRHTCYRERSYRDSMIWKARNFGDRELFQNAQNMKMPSCDRLQQLRQHG